MPDIYFLNEQYLKLEDAKVSINDRGFQFGDSVYEVIRSYRGKLFHLDMHLKRFESSAEQLEIPMPYPQRDLRVKVEEAYLKSEYPEAKIYLQLTRGTSERGHAYPPGLVPTFLITVLELRPFPTELKKKGVEIVSIQDIRWGRCDIKSTNLLANVLAQQKAKREGVYEAVMIRNNKVTEGSISNFFLVKEGGVLTPPLNHDILPGVTRDLVLMIARDLKITVREETIPANEIYDADEVFLSGTTVEIVPVVRIDGRQIGNGLPGLVTKRLIEEFQIYTKIA